MITKIGEIVRYYYKMLDSNAPVEEFGRVINWDNFEIINGLNVINSYAQYKEWYAEVQKSMSNKKHTIRDMKISKLTDDQYRVRIDMFFKAETNIEVFGKIDWLLVKNRESSTFKVEKYIITEE